MEGSGLSLQGGAGPSLFDSSTDKSSIFDGSVDDSDTAINVGLGYRFLPRFSAELSYTDFGELTFDGVYMGISSVGKVTATAFEATGIYHQPIARNFEVVAQVGLVLWDAEEEELFGGMPESDSDVGASGKAGLGLQARVAGPLALRLTYDRYLDIWEDPIDVILLRALISF